MKRRARFCPHCGMALSSAKEIRARRRLEMAEWSEVKGVIFFYFLYLVSVLPLYWLPDEHRATGTMVAAGVDVIVILCYWRISRLKLRGLFIIDNRMTLTTLMGLGLLVPLLGLNIGYHTFLSKLLELEPDTLPDIFELAGFGTLTMVFFTCVMPGVWEEIAFRGLIQQRLRSILNPGVALVLTSILFAVIHCTPLSWPYLMLTGLLLGWLRERSGSLIPGMVIHFAHNLIVSWL